MLGQLDETCKYTARHARCALCTSAWKENEQEALRGPGSPLQLWCSPIMRLLRPPSEVLTGLLEEQPLCGWRGVGMVRRGEPKSSEDSVGHWPSQPSSPLGAATPPALFTDIDSWANGYGGEVDLWGYGPYTGLSCSTLKARSWSNLCHHPLMTKPVTVTMSWGDLSFLPLKQVIVRSGPILDAGFVANNPEKVGLCLRELVFQWESRQTIYNK